eukprot:TRINITY_DN5957_c0_g4_i1.p1 TRINITY_DN5957_c0_g4~~TRINITY_DN5957_c0_g4_i1.p1  ORF type:complete len:555 (+),score=62.70 TRINITY_DN5957_c0_g4_i1:64-1665(+)
MQVRLAGLLAVAALPLGQSFFLDGASSPGASTDEAESSDAVSGDATKPSLDIEKLPLNQTSKTAPGKRCLTIAGTYRIQIAGETVDDSLKIHQTGCMATASGKNLNGGMEFSIEDNALKHGKYGILGMVQTNGDIILDDNAIAERQQEADLAAAPEPYSIIEEDSDTDILETVGVNSSYPLSEKFCWKDNYYRGIGSLPLTCARGFGKHGSLCFEQCPPGSERTWASGFSCMTKCPKGWSDEAWHCRNGEYTRGVGYSYWNRDACPRENPHGCEWHGSTYYPKCKSGYEAVGCCICRPMSFKCKDFGDFAYQTDISCGKSVRGNMFPSFGVCAPPLERQAGMCYKPCRPGYVGVGPMCWSKSSVVGKGSDRKHWVGCGMGAAESEAACTTLFPKILGPVQVVADIATYGESFAAFKGPRFAPQAGLIGVELSKLTGLTVHTSMVLRKVQKVFLDAMTSIAKLSAELAAQRADEGPAAPARAHEFARVVAMAKEAAAAEEMAAVAAAALALYNPLDSITSVFKQASCSSIGESA